MLIGQKPKPEKSLTRYLLALFLALILTSAILGEILSLLWTK